MRENRTYVADLEEKLQQRMEQILLRKKHELAIYTGKVEALSPLKKLSQGFAYIEDLEGKPLKEAAQVKENDTISIHLRKGRLKATVTEVAENE